MEHTHDREIPPGFEDFCLVVGVTIDGTHAMWGHDHVTPLDVVQMLKVAAHAYALDFDLPPLPIAVVSSLDQWFAQASAGVEAVITQAVEDLDSDEFVGAEHLAATIGEGSRNIDPMKAATGFGVMAVRLAKLRKGSGER